MKNPLLYLVLLAASLAPIATSAQNNGPPSYTFGGMIPGMFGGSNQGLPGGFINNGQSPFLTMPSPQYPFANPQFPNAATGQNQLFPANPMAQPIPFWMQTPSSPQAQRPPRFITDVPRNVRPQNAPPSYTLFSPPGFSPSGPPRWAPLGGQTPFVIQSPRSGNAWAIAPPFTGQAFAPVAPRGTPPKWPTP